MTIYDKKIEIKPNVCIVTSPRPKAGIIPVSNLIDVLSTIVGYLYIITGNEARVILKDRKDIDGYSIENVIPSEPIPMVFNYLLLQLKITYLVLKKINKINIFVFFEGEYLLIPLLVAKIFRKQAVLGLAASMPNIIDAEGDSSLRSKILKSLEKSNYKLSDKIILFSPRLVEDWHLKNYRNKIVIARQHFIDLNHFNYFKNYEERKFKIAFIGRLEPEKGAFNLVKAIPGVKEIIGDSNLLIGGCGSNSKNIKKFIDDNNLNQQVVMSGWIPHDELPKYLNDIKIMVLPSYTEGLPNILLESMACGTVVLTTPVGAIPDFVKDGITGFILEDNSPGCIERNIMRVLQFPDLEKVSINARRLIEQEMTFDVAVNKWRNVFRVICS